MDDPAEPPIFVFIGPESHREPTDLLPLSRLLALVY